MSVKIDQALLTAYIAGNFGLPIAHENVDYTPGAEAYAEVSIKPNDITAASLSHSNKTDGVFQITLRYPVGTGSIATKKKADEIFAAFPIGRRLTYEGVTLTIKSNHPRPGYPEAAWYKTVLIIAYTANLPRN